MITSVRATLVFAFALSAAAAIVVACGSDEARFSSDDGVDASHATLPDSSSVVEDAGARDADADAPVRPAADASDEPVTCATTPCVTQLTAGEHHFCARLSDGTVRCWGDDTKGELGEGARDGGPTIFGPVSVATLANVTQVSAAGAASCAVRDDGHVLCWGDNSFAHLGLKPPTGVTGVVDDDRHPTPADVGIAGKAVRVDLGPENVYAIAEDAGVYGWGNNDYMQLTIEDYNFYAPRLLDVHGYALSRIGASFGATVALTKDAQLVNWGRVSGRASTVPQAMAPFPLLSLPDVTSVAIDSANDSHACAVSHGSLYCWGANTKGALGIGVPDSEIFPTLAPLSSSTGAYPQQVAAGANSTCVRMTDGTIQCAGDNTLGELGIGTAGPLTLSFAAASAFQAHAVQVAVSLESTCALVQDGTVMCWGGNSKGELGQGTNDLLPHPTPKQVVFAK